MGDNIFLGDRDGVRTPMQWSPDRNGGFSRADPARLYLPPIMDPIYGFEAVNVEAQQRDPSSLLNWMKRMIAVRQQHPAFGRGTLRLLYPRNRKILAYLREHEGDTILCVANLARSAQAVELDLGEFRGRVPVELLGRSPFPPIGDLPYLLTLPAYGFYWFVLAEEAELPRWHEPMPEPLPDFITLVMRDGWSTLIEGPSARELARDVLPAFLAKQRWFGAKDLADQPARRSPTWAELAPEPRAATCWPRSRSSSPGARRRSATSCRSRTSLRRSGADPRLAAAVVRARPGAPRRQGRRALRRDGGPRLPARRVRGDPCRQRAAEPRMARSASGRPRRCPTDRACRRTSRSSGCRRRAEQLLGHDRQPRWSSRPTASWRPACSPSIEIGRFLIEEARLRQHAAAARRDRARRAPTAQTTALAAAFGFVRNQGDGWVYTIEYLHRDARRAAPGAPPPSTPKRAALAARAARLLPRPGAGPRAAHRRAAPGASRPRPTIPAFAAEPITRGATSGPGSGRCAARPRRRSRRCGRLLPKLDGRRSGAGRRRCSARRDACLARIDALTEAAGQRAARPGSTATIISARCWSRRTTSTSSTSRASRRARSPSAAPSRRRSRTSPACCARSTTPPGPRSMSLAEARSGQRARSCDRWPRRGAQATAEAFLDAYRETIAGCPSYPRERGRGRAPARSLPAREGALRDLLRSRQPTGLGPDPAQRRDQPAGAGGSTRWHQD